MSPRPESPSTPTPAGYSGTPLIKKLGIKPDSRFLLVAAPPDFGATLGPLPEGARAVGPRAKGADVTLVFCERATRLTATFTKLAGRMATDGSLWVAWPKKSSKRPTDLDFDAVRTIGIDAGLVDVKICAVDETWSGLKFMFRREDRAARDAAQNNGAPSKPRPKRKA